MTTPTESDSATEPSATAEVPVEEVWSSLSVESTEDPASQKVCQIIDLNLFVSSSDVFRDAVGGYFHAPASEDVTLKFTPFDFKRPQSRWLQHISTYQGASINFDTLPGATDYGTIVPNSTFVASVHGDSNLITDDKHWKTIWTGGTIDDLSYWPMFVSGTYEDHYINIRRPYPKIDSHTLKNPETVTNWVDISYQYKHNLTDYQTYADNVTSELYLPNWYLLKHAGINESTGSGDFADPRIYEYISVDGADPDVYSYFTHGAPAIVQYREDDPDTHQNENLDAGLSMAGEYLNSFSTSSLQTSTQEYAMKKLKNVMFNNNFFTQDGYSDYSESITGSMGYYTTISFETTANTTSEHNNIFAGMAVEYEMDTLLLRLLKEAFLEQTPLEITPHQLQYNKYIKYLSSSAELDSNEEIKEYANIEYRGVNFVDLMLYSYHKIQDIYEDFAIIDSNNLQTRATYDTKGTYRHYNTAAATKMLNFITGISKLNMHITDLSDLLNGKDQAYEGGLEYHYEGTPVPKYNEVIAYRIEKTGIADPNSATPTSQNFWFFNSKNINSIDFFDTQIKYDKDYTYKIYSYNIVIGLKYRYSGLQLSRVIGQAYEDPHDTTEKIESGFCIEYYDPTTDATVNDLLTSETYYSDGAPISDLATEAQRIAYDIQTLDARPYRANFAVTIQPSVKIMEIPVYEKTQRVLDHPPSYMSITPSFTEDDTNRLSFLGSYQSFVPHPYPNTITSEDVNIKNHYLHANNILGGTLIDLPTVSRQSSIDIYRIEQKPTSYESFDGAFLKTIDLTVEGFESSYTDIYFYDMVKSNKKYYYLFRASNELGMAGYFEEVLSAELVNDGGYKYAIFNTLFEEDFGEEQFVETSRPAKKLFQLTPAAAQRSVNTENVNYDESAAEQFDNVTIGEAEDLIWNKTFKVRLTSKKTNKKIDLNIKYLQTDDIY